MTTPTGRDFPDYIRRMSRVDEIVIDATVGRGAGITESIVFPMAGVPGLSYRITPFIGHMLVTVDWFLDLAATNFLTVQSIHTRNGVEFHQSLPALGPFCRMTFDDTSVADTTGVKVATSGFLGIPGIDHNLRRLNASDLTNIAAGATSTATSFAVLCGLASLQFLSEAATFTVTVSSVTFDNVATVMYRFDEAGGLSQSHLISIPAQPTRIAVTNNSAAAANFSWFLHIIDPPAGIAG